MNFIPVSRWKDDRSRCLRKQCRSMSTSLFPWLIFTSTVRGTSLRRFLGTICEHSGARNSSRYSATPFYGSDTRRYPRHRRRSSHPRNRSSKGDIIPWSKRSWTARVRQIEQGLKPGEKLLVYADCGREWDKTAPSGETISVEGDAYLFPGSRDVFESEPAFGYVVSGNPARLQIEGLRPGKKYKLFISWWDFDNGKRIQSIRLQSKDGSRSFPALEPTALPTYYEKNELGKTYSFDIPGELVKAGSFDCLIELVRGPNAVISEAWLVEVPD